MGIHKTIKIKCFGDNCVEMVKVNDGHYVIYAGKTSHPKYDPSAKTLKEANAIFDKLVYLFEPEKDD